MVWLTPLGLLPVNADLSTDHPWVPANHVFGNFAGPAVQIGGQVAKITVSRELQNAICLICRLRAQVARVLLSVSDLAI
jgi:hypothetical protein